ncbi:MAG: hypothetical protein CMJ83_11575 [Planctomycetes bacterium]|nr:hypothetical protein [Planctomycetota bacterium]
MNDIPRAFDPTPHDDVLNPSRGDVADSWILDLEQAATALRRFLAAGDDLPVATTEGLTRHLGGAFPSPDIDDVPDLPPPCQPLPNPADFVAMLMRAESDDRE